jgi:NAD(P)H-nitrite reductase large subunit
MTPPSINHNEAGSSDHVVCHCLRVMASQIQAAIEGESLASVPDVCRSTGAGTGCMACRVRIGRFLKANGATGPG